MAASRIADLQRLAGGLLEDRAAVEAAFQLPRSNGQTESQINKLQLLKRSRTVGPPSISSACASCTRPDAVGAVESEDARLSDV